MKKIKESIESVSVVFIGALVFVIILPVVIVTLPFLYYKRKKFEKQYKKFLLQNEGMNFFCYNNRKNAKDFIEKEILPDLNDKIDVVFLNGKTVENNRFPKAFLSSALTQLKNYSKFPHLMKISNGELIDKSINSLFYSVLKQHKTKEKLMNEINDFFEFK